MTWEQGAFWLTVGPLVLLVALGLVARISHGPFT